MDNKKKWYQSLTANASVAGIIISGASIVGAAFKQPDLVPAAHLVVNQGFPLIEQGALFITSLLTLIGRIRANSTIGK
jgi:hypothetical protein